MAKPARKASDVQATNRRGHWQEEIAKASKRYDIFVRSGKLVVDRYRLERDNAAVEIYQDRYNILYSSTETIRPSLYAQTPKVQATKRHKDRTDERVTLATLLLEGVCQYALEEIDFDEVMSNVVEDYLLPGMGVAWVRYVPTFEQRPGEKEGEAYDALTFEGIDVDYVHYRDFLTGVGRVWKELPWVARRVYHSRAKVAKRWGADIANKLSYSYRPADDGTGDREAAGGGGHQAIIWEIWDKENHKVVWYCEDYSEDVLEEIDDPLKLTNFFPCPRPIRAVHTTRTFVPKAYYSQYKAQAEELDNLTARIRHLTQALRAIGVYDGSQEQLQQLLNGTGNKMVGVQNWAAFAQNGGIAGSIQWVPIKDVATVLTELMRQRELVKNEIYEISGFSDIVRGVTKASETLGAQEIKSNWATGRLRDMQKEVQRFCRDIIRIVAEIVAEQFSEETLALYSGFEPPEVTPEEQAAAAQYAVAMEQYQSSLTLAPVPGAPPPQPPQKPGPTLRQQALHLFMSVVELLKNEKLRAANVGIETDSTIMPDEAAERKDRMEFLAAAGAFLQQAVPAMQAAPQMGGLLGAILMFTIRTFRASRPLEKEFEDFTKSIAANPPQPPQGEGGGDDPASAQATAQGAVQQEQLKQQGAQLLAQIADATERYKIDTEAAIDREKVKADHEFRMAQLALKAREVAVREAELGIKQAEVQHNQQVAEVQEHRADRALEQDAQATDRQLSAAEEAARNKPQPGKKEA